MIAAAPTALLVIDAATWSQAFDAWMATLPANTARAYRQSWSSLLQVVAMAPREIRRSQVAQWAEQLHSNGLSASTINQRLAGISSYYRFVSDSYGLEVDNPAAGKALRPKYHPWQGAHYLDVDAVRAFLAAINPNTLQGSRDYALFLTYLFTGRRNSEIRNLRWADIENIGGEAFYRWQGKGNTHRGEMPAPVINAIQNYLQASNRFKTISKDDFIFIATSDCASRLTGQPISDHKAGSPISARQVSRLLNRYAKAAGIETHFRVCDLRHTAAMLRKAAGDDTEKISNLLGHSSLNTTGVYLHALEGRADISWKTVGEMLGFSDGKDLRVHASTIALAGAI